MPLQIYTEDNQLIGQYGNDMSLPVSYEQIPKIWWMLFSSRRFVIFFSTVVSVLKALVRTDRSGERGIARQAGQRLPSRLPKIIFYPPNVPFNRKLTELF